MNAAEYEVLAISYEVTTPPTKLMFDFVDYFIGKSVVLHANTKDMKMDLQTVAKEVNKLGKYDTVASYRLIGNEREFVYSKFLLIKSSKKKFNFFTSILPDYMADETTKEF